MNDEEPTLSILKCRKARLMAPIHHWWRKIRQRNPQPHFLEGHVTLNGLFMPVLSVGEPQAGAGIGREGLRRIGGREKTELWIYSSEVIPQTVHHLVVTRVGGTWGRKAIRGYSLTFKYKHKSQNLIIVDRIDFLFTTRLYWVHNASKTIKAGRDFLKHRKHWAWNGWHVFRFLTKS